MPDQAVLEGDAHLNTALLLEEELDMDLVHMAADEFHQCIILTRWGREYCPLFLQTDCRAVSSIAARNLPCSGCMHACQPCQLLCDAVHARERVVEMEAIGSSRLGTLHARVLKNDDSATRFCKRCIELAEAMYPVPYTKRWYQARPLAHPTPSYLLPTECYESYSSGSCQEPGHRYELASGSVERAE